MNPKVWIDHALAPALRDQLHHHFEVQVTDTWSGVDTSQPRVVIVDLAHLTSAAKDFVVNAATRLIALLPTDCSCYPSPILEAVAGQSFAILSANVPIQCLYQTIRAAFANLEVVERVNRERDC